MSYDYADFERFATSLRLDSGDSLKLEDFQVEILQDHFKAARQLTVIIGKKNYKTTTMAAVALFHLHETKQADVPILAASSKQAGIMFRQAANFVRNSGTKVKGSGSRSQDLKDVFEIDGVTYEIRTGFKEIRANGGLLYVVAADTDRLDGVIPSLALVDELHRHRNGDNYRLLSDGLTPRKARMITISTAGSSEDSPLGVLRTKAHAYRNRKVDGCHTRYQQGTNVVHEWALTPAHDPENMRHVKEANPAKVNTLTELRRRRTEPMTTLGSWLRFACGIWTEGDEPAITPDQWDGLKGDVGHVEPGEAVWMAAHVGETAWIAIVAPREDGVACKVVSIGEDKSGVLTEAELVKLADVYDVREIAHPRTTFMRSAQILETDHGLPMTETPYSPARFAVISSTFKRLMDSGLLMHDGDPALRAQVMAATAKDTETGWRYVLSPRSAALITLANACHQATNFAPEPMIVFPRVG